MTAPEWAGRVRFGDTWAGYVGPAGDQNAHAHAAVQITLALEDSVTLASDSGELAGSESAAEPVDPERRERLIRLGLTPIAPPRGPP